MPLKGEQAKDCWIDYHVDHDESSGISDGMCGSRTNDGHKGTDFLIRSFKVMDSGVMVSSIADGILYWKQEMGRTEVRIG